MLVMQSARGDNLQILEETYQHHTLWCKRHGADYLCVLGPVSHENPAESDPLDLLFRAAMTRPEGSLVVWLDPCALVLELERDPREILREGKSLGIYAGAPEIGKGCVAFRVDPTTKYLFEVVWGSPLDKARWDHHLEVSTIPGGLGMDWGDVLRLGQYGQWLDPEWCADASVDSPVIRYLAEGSLEKKLNLLQKLLGQQ